MKTVFTSALTINAEMIMGSSCLGMIPAKFELQKTILGMGDDFCVFFIFLEDKLRTSWSCFLLADFIVPPPAKPPVMTLIVLIIGSSSLFSSQVFSSFEVLWFLRFLLSSSLWGDALLFLGLFCDVMYFTNLPSLIPCSILS